MKHLFLLLLLTVLPSMVFAQPATTPDADSDAFTATELTVQERIAGDGVYVVHFWAPWCHNSRDELSKGFWNTLVEEYPDVEFIFVTVFNNGNLGENVLNRHNLPERVLRLAQPDYGESRDRSQRRTHFLGHPINWTPTTWIFSRKGKLSYAVNYGEVDLSLMQALLQAAKRDWSP